MMGAWLASSIFSQVLSVAASIDIFFLWRLSFDFAPLRLTFDVFLESFCDSSFFRPVMNTVSDLGAPEPLTTPPVCLFAWLEEAALEFLLEAAIR